MERYFLIIDQGTSGTKSFIFNEKGEVCFSEKFKHFLDRPKPLHVECDAQKIADVVNLLITSAINWANEKKGMILSLGIAVQRSTFLFWDKESIQPLTPALSWQDNRAHHLIGKFNEHKKLVYRKTGTPLSGHFGALKYIHFIKEYPELVKKLKSGKTFFGPLSSYLSHVLSGTAVLDHSIAGRSQLFSLDSLNWDDTLCELFNVNLSCLPPLVPTLHNFGKIKIDKKNIPLLCIIGDQQSALMGHGFSSPGMVSINLGTSGSVQYCTSDNQMFINGLLSNLLWSSNHKYYFLLEGTINSCNSLFYWLENHLNIPHKQMKWDERCEKTKTRGVLVPDFTGIASPYWAQPKKTVFYNLNNATDDEIIRAGMESIGFFVHDIIQTLKKDGLDITSVQSAGGGARKPLLQFIADLLDVPVKRPKLKDKTALGVFRLLFKKQFGEFPEIINSFQEKYFPKMTANQRKEKLDTWEKALTVAGIKPRKKLNYSLSLKEK